MAAILYVYAGGLIFMNKKNKKFLFQKENGNTIALLIIFLVKSLQKEQKAQIMEYKPQSAGINLQSPQSDSTPWTLTLLWIHFLTSIEEFYINGKENKTNFVTELRRLVIT